MQLQCSCIGHWVLSSYSPRWSVISQTILKETYRSSVTCQLFLLRTASVICPFEIWAFGDRSSYTRSHLASCCPPYVSTGPPCSSVGYIGDPCWSVGCIDELCWSVEGSADCLWHLLSWVYLWRVTRELVLVGYKAMENVVYIYIYIYIRIYNIKILIMLLHPLTLFAILYRIKYNIGNFTTKTWCNLKQLAKSNTTLTGHDTKVFLHASWIGKSLHLVSWDTFLNFLF